MQTPFTAELKSFNRRDFLNVVCRLGIAGTLGSQVNRKLWAKPHFEAYPFSLGVASGDPEHNSVVLWTRLAPHPLEGGGMPMLAVEVEWELASDEQMLHIVRTGVAMAYAELGHSVHVEIDNLLPNREYWYRFVVNGVYSPVGRTLTSPAYGQATPEMRIGVCGCNHYEHGFFTAYKAMADERFDAILHTGDYIYEHGRNDKNGERVRDHVGAEIFTLEDYRNRYALYKLDPDLQAAHASAPFIASWDDHEVDNDWAAEFNETNTPSEVFRLRRAAAFQAYYESMPLRRSSFPRQTHLQLFRQIGFGDLLNISVLDTRQYRSRQACRLRSDIPCTEFTEADRTMLGTGQERWLSRNLNRSDARWEVLAQQVPMFGQVPTSDNTQNRHVMDKWSGYPAARERLAATITSTDASVVVLSGDIHSHWAADVPLRMDDAQGASIAVELTTTSISSGGDGSETVHYWDAIRSTHPHVHFHNNRRGYLSCRITRESIHADFITIDSVRQRGGKTKKRHSVVVAHGNPHLLEA